MGEKEKKFYNKTWFIWTSLIIFAPLGIFLLWRSKKYGKEISIPTSIMSALLFIMILGSGTNNIENTTTSAIALAENNIIYNTLDGDLILDNTIDNLIEVNGIENQTNNDIIKESSSLAKQESQVSEEKVATQAQTSSTVATKTEASTEITKKTEQSSSVPESVITPVPTPQQETKIVEEKKTSSQSTSTIESASTQSQTAKQDTQGQYVYITKTGSKYHKDGCQYLKESKIQMLYSEAVSSGYEPCKKCY